MCLWLNSTFWFFAKIDYQLTIIVFIFQMRQKAIKVEISPLFSFHRKYNIYILAVLESQKLRVSSDLLTVGLIFTVSVNTVAGYN